MKVVIPLIWIFALVLLVVMLNQLPVESISSWIHSLSLVQWVIWSLLNIMIVLIYVLRWFQINRGLEFNTGFINLLMVRQAGQSFSYITPGPQFGGEPLQVLWLWKNQSTYDHHAFLSVALDRFFELWINFSVLIIGIVVLIYFSTFEPGIWYFPLFVIVVMIAGLLFLGRLVIVRDHFVNKWIKKSIIRWQHSPKLKGLEVHLDNISTDVRNLLFRNRKAFGLAILFSVLGWVGMLLELGLILTFLGIELALMDYIFLVVVMRLALLLPVPGGIGTMESAIFWVFISLDLNTFDVMGMITLIRLRDVVLVLFGMGAFQFLMKKSITRD